MTETKNGIVEVDLNEKMRKSYLDYSMSVIVARALPDVRDGLKPVHRRIIHGMQVLGLVPTGQFKKSARLVGDVMGKFHPHGDSSIYDATVRLAQTFSTRYPLVDGQGNFGNIDGYGAAAMRYTEVRMSKLALEMLRDINKETVDFAPNFDEEEMEPVVLPSRFPNLLVNGSNGIAVGMATNMPPHNLAEVINGVVEYIDNNDITIDELMKTIKGPDFPTGAQIMGRDGIKRAYQTGRGKIQVRAVAEFEEVKNKTRIVVTEIPYQVNKSNLIMKIAQLAKEKIIDGITAIRDESSRKGIRIVIDLRRDANPNVVLNKLYKNTQMQTTFGIINLALVGGVPKVLNLKELITHYVDHQIEVVSRRSEFDLNKAKARAHIVEGLKIALDNIERIIQIVRGSNNDQEAKDKFLEEFGLSDAQSQAILDMRIRRLTGLERDKLDEEYKQLLETIEWLTKVLENHDVLMGVIKEELIEIRDKHSDLRRTVIKNSEGDIEIEDIIKEEDVIITLTQSGYIKRMPEGTYKPQKRGGRGISATTPKDGDFVSDLFITSSHESILFFTTRGRVYRLKAYEIPESSRQSKGTQIRNLLNLEQDESVESIIHVKDFDSNLNIVMATKSGIVKRTSFEEFQNIRKSGLIAITLKDGDSIVSTRITTGEEDIMLVTKDGMSIRFKETDIRKMARTAMGVKGISLNDDDEVVSMEIASDDKLMLVISEKGYGKLTPMSEYKVQNRAGKGIITYKVKSKTGKLVSAKIMESNDDIMMITSNGIIIRIQIDGISVMGRSTSGVKLMNITDSDVVAVAKYIGD
ncbi:DNA gyrase subunit A [Peptoniphilus asaccharolyticus DSM 20463]|uniref:DNA gyrase subunit A n=1 Tax=Peptoniphilus asaccharolyticus DSM 20463 TaxID=573058 RepID=A0A1W1V3Q8_PEPAS|nr:DNA gyrase subunit A [Peptoniphilus asaccharolyticus]MBL7576244.1 DNA gyrase subunit A [Peptoniphilus asaccharolyticus]SMB87938.1 DNA gyrase subunit A [Peptoniphilus asaccharolyticus DSM 20463]